MAKVTQLKPNPEGLRMNHFKGLYLIEKKVPGSRSQVIHLSDDEIKQLVDYWQSCQPKSS